MVKVAIFDLDGTLCNTLLDFHTTVNAVRKAYGFGEVSVEFARENINGDVRQVIEAIIPNIAKDEVDNGVKIYKSEYAKCYMDQSKPYDGIVDMLKQLKAKGIKIAIFSNKLDEFVKNMSKKLFDGLIDYPLGAGIYASKPNRDGVDVILNSLGATVEETAYIGDSDVDFYTNRNCGTHGIQVTWGYRSREYLENLGCKVMVDTVDELVKKILEI
ncbi:MAG: HAD family hydrolase [Clostridia bacterium]|nr:HAD family hydrolase [Clostridia bacterium]